MRVYNQVGESGWLDLPASGWSTYQSGTRTQLVFKNREAPLGPSTVKLAVLRDQQLIQLAARSSGLTLDEASQGAVGIQLIIGSDVYCSECTAPTRDAPGGYKASRCPAPASCPATYCGNGVTDQSSGEQCDAPDPGICFIQGVGLGCEQAGTPGECTCCGGADCFFGLFFTLDCCGDSRCQDVTGAGQQRSGACIPPSCTQDAECHGYRCEGGVCCGDAGQLCGVAGCCQDSGATCSASPFLGASICCRPAGAGCANLTECCSFSCTAGVCDP